MMPNVKGERSTKNQIFVYAIIMALCGIAPYFIGFAGITYGALSTILGVIFVYRSYELWKTVTREQTVACAKKLFFFSLFYLAALFAVLLVESLATRLMSYLGA
ncbi:protoheme IX farnesyltransferase [Bartonella choladocola]|uniref:Heme O synthase n=2 Tax=Bartonellaceae TaxID=772 RepID=A0A1U9MG70_9HYPH|nr:protoheme IX farnesyltransferase [Bartonella choladocola]